ncbi:dockerin type I repeat-containing protein [uncultured Ruminococcus sp.]|uniref:dockerin type I repeat-containing protein n=1 Tax=uncultured Ruminococcus sp. TaxID=165186 RepID=UPI0025E8AB33|nr:dockerin type I repeat-containing protein [uncultured Ruminococcus sp.]
MLRKLPDAVSVTGHLALYEDTVNYASASDGIRISSPSGMGAEGESNKELIDLALSLGYKLGRSSKYAGASVGEYDIFLSKEDADDSTNSYKLFKYLEDNGYRYGASVTTTELALVTPTVYFCNIPYTMDNEPPADLGDDAFNQLRDLNADTFKNVFRLYNTPVRFVFSEYSNIDEAFDSKYMNICYYVVEHTDGWFSFYNEELQEYKSGRSTIRDGKEVKLPYGEVEQRAYEVYLDSDIVKERISSDVVIKEKYFLSGESNHMGTAVYFKTSAGDYVYFTNYDVGEVFMPVAEFCKLQKAIRDEIAKYPDDNGGGAVEITGVYDISPYRLSSETEEITDFTQGEKTMTLDDVKVIAKKKQNITWSDFEVYKGEWNGTGMYTYFGRFDLENGYYLLVGGNPPEKPEIIRLYRNDASDFIDLRYHNVDKFLSDTFFSNLRNMTEEEMKAYFAENDMTERRGYRVWTAESAAKAAENYHLSFLVDLPPEFTDSKGNVIINEVVGSNDVSKMLSTDGRFEEQFEVFLRSLVGNTGSLFNMGNSHFYYINEDTDAVKYHKRYIKVSANPISGSRYTKEEAADMFADALNLVQLSPKFAGFEYDSKIPLYGKDDKGTLKGDSNNDGQVDMSDVVLIMQCLANPDKYKLSEEGRANADTDGDGVTVGDAQNIQKHLLGIIDYITDLDTIRKMINEYCEDQYINISVVPKEKMPEQFADKYVFVRKDGADTHSRSSLDIYLIEHYVKTDLILNTPYDPDDDSELNLIREKIYCYMLENNVRSIGIDRTNKEMDAINQKVIITYEWYTPEEEMQKLRDFVENSGFDSDLVEFRWSGLE